MHWRSQRAEGLQTELERLVLQIEPRLPILEDYSLPGDRKAALREVEQLLSGALNPNDYGERSELLYLKAYILIELRRRRDAAFACRMCESEATRAFFDSKHSLWIELRWHRIRNLGEQQQWLAFERALSEMIGWLEGSSRRTNYGRDLSTAYYARGLCYQLRGLLANDSETTEALLAAGLRDLEQVVDREERERAIAEARDSIAQWQRKPGKGRTVAPNVMPDSIGLLRFSDWPQDSQTLFLNGANRTSRGRFFAEKDPYGILFVLVLFLFFAFAFALGLGNIPVMGILVYVPAVLMILSVVRIVRDLCTYRQKKRAGAIVYGFLINSERLAVRTIEAFSDETYFFGENSVLLPLERILGSSIGRKPTYATSGRMRHVDVLVIRYMNNQDKLQYVRIPERFNVPVKKIHNLLQTLNHDLVGTWQTHFGDDTLHFDRESGTVTNYGKSLHFRWQEIDGGAIAIAHHSESPESAEITYPEITNELQSGLYHFNLNAKGNVFELIFLKGFGGTSLQRFERTSTPSNAAMDPARVAMRLVASEPLPKLGP